MSATLLVKNRNFRLLFSASALTNLGDGLILLALPWLASLMTRDPVAIAAVAAANRLPWLLFALPAGVVADRVDRRRLIARADVVRAVLVAAIMVLALGNESAGAMAVWALAGLAFLLGAAEVLRDNAAQTVLPSIVAKDELEAANGQLWSIEQLTGQFIGPPLAGVLIAAGVAVPFGVDAVALLLAAGLVWMIAIPAQQLSVAPFWAAMKEGIGYMRQDRLLLRLAVVLGCANFLATATITVQVLFAQEVLGLSAATYGVVLSVAAAGAIFGSLMAPRMVRWWGVQMCLYLSIGVWGLGYAFTGGTGSGAVMAVAQFGVMAAAMLWNVITVSWRQRRIPAELLGRVNGIYRCFGWGSMPLGALAGGAVVALWEPLAGRELALRMPFFLSAAGCAALLGYAVWRLRLSD